MRLIVCTPLKPGMAKSLSSRSKSPPSSTALIALAPSAVATTSKPCSRNCSPTTVRTASSSSTSRIERTVVGPCAAQRLGPWRDGLRGRGQDHVDRRAAADLARDQQAAARLLDEAEHHRQPQPGALAGLLGGVERLGDLLDLALGDAVALVGDADAQIISRRQRWRVGQVGLARLADRHGHLAAVGHGVARVEDEVEQREFELRLVDEQIAASVRGHCQSMLIVPPSVCSTSPATDWHRLFGIDAGRAQILLAREGHHPPHQFGAMLGGVAHLVEDDFLALAHASGGVRGRGSRRAPRRADC